MEQVTLTLGDLQVLSDLDSKQFGFLQLGEEVNARKKAIVLKAINYLERVIVRTRERARNKEDERKNGDVDPKIYSKLGHLHLLLEDYSKALSAYQKYMRMTSKSSKKVDQCLLYGLGLVYFHFNAFVLAKRAFHDLLYLYPAFDRANEVHLRLGVMAKICGDYEISLKHLKSALSDLSAPCSFTQYEIKFHIAHVHEVRGDSHRAKELYEELLKETEISNNLKADVYRQLGWMFHSVEGLGERTGRLHTAIQYLQRSNECSTKKNHGQTLYLLGRCFSGLGKVHEAFVAYRTSVDKSESNADTWCSIGVLYQQQAQPMDALQAYICAVQLDKNHSAAWTNLGLLYESTRQPQDALACFNNAKASNSPHLHQRIKYLKAQLSNLPPPPPPPMQNVAGMKPKTLPSVEEAWNLPISNEMTSRHPPGGGANAKKELKIGAGPQQMVRPPFYLNQQQLQTLQYLQHLPTLTPQQQQVLNQLQHQFRLMQQHQHQQRQQQAQQAQQAQAAQQSESNTDELASKDIGSVSDKELEDLIAQQDIGSFAESLLKQIQADVGGDINDISDIKGAGETPPHSSEDELQRPKVKTLDIPTKLETVKSNIPVKLSVNIGMKGAEITEACSTFAKKDISISKVMDSVHSLPHVPDRPTAKLSKEQLLPPTPSVYLDNKKDAFSPQLQEFCLQHPITVVRGIANALKMDCGLFSTKALLETNPSQNIEIRVQLRPDSISLDAKNSWKCHSNTATTTLGKFCKYQMAQFQENLKEEQDKTTNSGAAAAAFRHEARRKACPTLKFTDNVDLADSRRWKMQLSELTKLPSWARVVSAGNMLSHLGYPIQGMNTAKLTMQVPNARSAADQESFCIININIGPGDCEWFGVPFEYWGALKTLCDKHGVNYLHSQWWPIMQDLMDDEIPVYRFLQRPGDLVWVNSGSVHWTQAQGWCNSVTWKVAPLTHKQYSLALERYEWNKLQNFKSTIGMTHLTWNLARNVRVSDSKLFEAVKKMLLQSLKQVILTQEYVKSLGIETKFHGHHSRDPANFCGHCDKEVFAIFFIRDEAAVIHCLNCAHRRSSNLKGFICLEEYKIKELSDVYDSFKLHQQHQPQPQSAQLPTSSAMASVNSAAAAQMAVAMAAQQAAAFQSSGINADLLATLGQFGLTYVFIMGIMTGAAGSGLVCQTAKCEVKLERLSANQQQDCSSKFKRPHEDDLRPPVKLKVKINGNLKAISSSAGPQPTFSQPLAQVQANSTAPRGGVPAPVRKTLPTYVPLPLPERFDPSLDSVQLKEAIEKLGFDPKGKISTSLLNEDDTFESIPQPPKRPNVPLTPEELLPPTPCVYVSDDSEAMSPQLLDVCLKRPIVLVRNLAQACRMDLGLYSTKTLVETHPNHPVEIRSQMEQTSDENWSPNMEADVWYCTSSRSHTTIAKYAEYQSEGIRDYIEKTNDKSANPKYDFSGQETRKMLRFGTNCDLSDEKKWGPQLRELKKLPAWARVVSAGNMLSHIGNQILGMNTVQLYMKVPCARTPGHQENNNFCAVNINIGPGDSEWFGVPNEYWGALQNLCAKNKVDYLHGSWWPKMSELHEAGIPCYRFMQRPGDLVWVNAGCVHWVQASGWCNNIAWNVGPLTSRQFELALERYEWNKSQRFQSIVAMCLLSWNLARNIKTQCPSLHKRLRRVLQQSLRASIQTQAFVRSKGVPVRFHGRRKNEPAHYCGVCDEEVFNNLFIKENEKRYVVHCLNCSLIQEPDLKGFICLEEYTPEDLFETYDNFVLSKFS